MANSFFQFKQFTVHQDKAAMKVGTDGVLLGAWVDASQASRILDVGSGTGLIALMMAQKHHQANIDAIEIDYSAYTQAKENVLQSNWAERIQIYHHSLQEYSKSSSMKYDLILSNPPYFNQSLKNECEKKSIARHTDSLSYFELIDGVTLLLKKNGIFYVILPSSEQDNFIKIANNRNLYLSKSLSIKPTPAKPAKRVIMAFTFSTVNKIITEELVIEEFGRHGYSEEYKNITREFYLAF